MRLEVAIRPHPQASEVDEFYALFRPLAKQRFLQVPPRPAVEAMCHEGDAELVVCRGADRSPRAIHILYRNASAGFYLYGARSGRETDGAAHYAHWETILALKRRGVAWYDLGQVPSREPDDGIFAFKESFGGSFLSYGTEIEWAGPGVSVLSRWLSPLTARARGAQDDPR